MSRWRLFELEDQPWFPKSWHEATTGFLSEAARANGQMAFVVPKIEEILRRSGADRIVDLGSGGGAPVSLVVESLRARGLDVTAVATDLRPNPRALRDTPGVAYEAEPVDATGVPERLTGVRTMFNAFHHLPPPTARAMLGDAVRRRQPVAVVEMLGREPLVLLSLVLFLPLAIWLLMWRVKPRRASALFFTYVIPAIVVASVWDGLVSCLRVYSPEELRALTADFPEYEWETGKIRLGKAPAYATFLIGFPRAAGAGAK